ncbi:MAG: efflux RND transporter periplasmic adaptor subunit [Lachnospiraceae bacterium]|nr:efflux RND transporter periplasmic adaptor subunit [Lachnospiraceae bacterium]
MKNKKILAAMMVSVATLMGCGFNETIENTPVLVEEDEEVSYSTAEVNFGSVVKNVTLSGEYTPTETESLYFPVNNRLITKVYVDKNDYVNAGTLIAELDVADIEDRINDLKYEIESEELELSHTLELRDFDLNDALTMYEGYSKKTADDKKAYEEKKADIEASYKTSVRNMEDDLKIKKARLADYRKELNEGRLYSSITGQVTYLASRIEKSYSSETTLIATISNLETSYFVVKGLDYADYFESGSEVVASYKDAGKTYEILITPTEMDKWEADECMYFESVDESAVKNGAACNIYLEVERKDDVLCVPTGAIHSSDKGEFVYIVNDGMLEMRFVTVGITGDSLTEITDGLKKGEIVAIKK